MKHQVRLIALLGAFWMAGVVQAGQHIRYSVVIDDRSMTASGSLGTARNSSNTYERIGCSVDSFGGSDKTVICTAREASGNSAECSTSDPGIFDLAMNIDSDSYVQFGWDASSRCSRLSVRKGSQTEPKQVLSPNGSLIGEL